MTITQSDNRQRPLRVAAFIRATTDSPGVLAARKAHYAELVAQNPEWTLSGIYADVGATRKYSKRPEWRRLMQDCDAHNIDLIVTKSIQTVYTSLVDFALFALQFRDTGIDIYFERENIMLSKIDDLYLSILMSLSLPEWREIVAKYSGEERKETEPE